MSKFLARRGYRLDFYYLGGNDLGGLPFRVDAQDGSRLVTFHPMTVDRVTRDFRLTIDRVTHLIESGGLPRCDILQVEGSYVPEVIAPALARKFLSEVPMTVDWGDYAHPLPPRYAVTKWVMTRLADHITACTTELARLEGRSGKPTTVIPSGANVDTIAAVPIEDARRSIGLPTDIPMIGFEFGTGNRKEYVDFLVSAFARLRRRTEVKIAFIGYVNLHWQQWYVPYLRRKAKEAGIENDMIITGPLGNRDFSNWLASCDLLLMPLVDDIIDRTRFPGRFCDYMAANRPVVVSEVGDVGRYVKGWHCGLTAKWGDVDGYVDVTLDLLRDQEGKQDAALKMSSLARHLSWESIASRLADVYDSLLD